MKTTLYLATTLNGYIAKPDNNVDWVSETQWDSYLKAVNEADCVVVGRKTYDLLDGNEEILPGRTYVVVSGNDKLKLKSKETIVVSPTNSSIQAYFQKSGFKKVLIIGGSQTNSAMLESGLVDEVMVDIEPLLLGKGIPLLSPINNLEINLDLIETKQLNKNLVQLRYKVK